MKRFLSLLKSTLMTLGRHTRSPRLSGRLLVWTSPDGHLCSFSVAPLWPGHFTREPVYRLTLNQPCGDLRLFPDKLGRVTEITVTFSELKASGEKDALAIIDLAERKFRDCQDRYAITSEASTILEEGLELHQAAAETDQEDTMTDDFDRLQAIIFRIKACADQYPDPLTNSQAKTREDYLSSALGVLFDHTFFDIPALAVYASEITLKAIVGASEALAVAAESASKGDINHAMEGIQAYLGVVNTHRAQITDDSFGEMLIHASIILARCGDDWPGSPLPKNAGDRR